MWVPHVSPMLRDVGLLIYPVFLVMSRSKPKAVPPW